MTPAPRASVARAGIFVLAGNIVLRLAGFIRAILIARLLAPDEVGRFALVAAILGVFEVVTHPGIHDALVQGDEVGEQKIRTGWTLLIVRGLLLSGVVYATADWASVMVREPTISPLIRWMAVIPFVRSLASMDIPLQRRVLNMRAVMTNLLIGSLVETLATVLFAIRWHDASALVVGAICGAVVQSAASYGAGAFRPRLGVAIAEARELLLYARWRFLWGIFFYVSTQGDDLVVGRVLGVAPLGFYRVAYRLGFFPASITMSTVDQVTFPALARLHREKSDEVGDAYGSYVRLVSSMAVPMATFFALFAEPVILVAVGSRWSRAAIPMALICFAASIRAITATGSALFLSAGRPAYTTAMEGVRGGTLLIALVGTAFWGLEGAAIAVIVSSLATIPVWTAGLRSIIGSAKVAFAGVPVFPATLIAGLVSYTGSRLLVSPQLRLLFGFAVFFVSLLLLVRVSSVSIWQEWRGLGTRVRKESRALFAPSS